MKHLLITFSVLEPLLEFIKPVFYGFTGLFIIFSFLHTIISLFNNLHFIKNAGKTMFIIYITIFGISH